MTHLPAQADDAELEAIRQRRMAQLMSQYGGGQVRRAIITTRDPPHPSAQGGAPSQEQMEQQEEQQRAAEERRQAMLAAVLQPAARERCTQVVAAPWKRLMHVPPHSGAHCAGQAHQGAGC